MNNKILFLANHFITLFSFRKELINRLVDDGYEVYLSLPKSDDNKYFEDIGCKIIETDIDRRGVNPIKDLKLLLSYKRIMKEINPSVIFSYTIKPNIYGCLASLNKYKQICNITGTGGIFLKNSITSKIVKLLYKLSMPHAYKIFFQNQDDRDYFIKNKMINSNYDLLPGSGCNVNEHPYKEMKQSKITKFIYIGRVMELKGVKEFVSAAKITKQKRDDVEFIIAGWNEEDNITKLVREHENDGYVKYIGFRNDILDWIIDCDCVVLASHGGEGIPNALLEACCTGRPCIGSNVSGIKDVIQDGVNGFIFEPKSTEDLVLKIEKYLSLSYEERTEMGKAGRRIVQEKFNREIVIQKYIDEVKDDKKKLLFFIGDLSSGGAERVLSVLTDAFINKDYSVEILKYYDNKDAYEINHKVKISSIEAATNSRNKLTNLLWLRKYFKNNKQTIISFLAPFNIMALIANNKNCPIIAADRNDPSKIPNNFLVRKLRDFLYERYANGVVVQTESNKEYFSKKTQAKSVVITNPIDPSLNKGSALDVEKENIIVSVGRLKKQKNHSLLIKSFKEISNLFPEYKLYIYGEGDYRNDLEELISNLQLSDKVFLPGNISNIFEHIKIAKLFVLSSDYEGMPNALIEAMCIGLPVISTKVSGAKEIIENNYNGLLIDVNNEEQLTKCLKELLSDERKLKELGINASKSFDNYSIEKIVEEWIAFLEKTER